jgi:fructuronate reductase
VQRLSDVTLSGAKVIGPEYDRSAVDIGIVHLGPGAFHRGHQADFTDRAMARSGGNWGICAVSLNSRRVAEALTPQDGLYTLAIRDKALSYRVIGAIKEVLCARDGPDIVLNRLSRPSVKFVTLTVTEKGYALTADGRLDQRNPSIQKDMATPQNPISAVGYLVEACRLRRAANIAPVTIISCDNLPENGHKLRTACLDYAEAVYPDMRDYIANNVRFPCTMVDSITPATDDNMRDIVAGAVGVRDAWPIQREAFTQWVIEDNLPDDRPDWHGVGATITHDVAGYEATKLRILNCAHSSLTYLGLLAGEETVEGAVNNPVLRGFVDDLIVKESIATISAPSGLDLNSYWEAIQGRFENPHIRHNLEQISHDGSQKIPVRILPVARQFAQDGKLARRACFVAAAWIVFNQTRRVSALKPTDGYLDQLEDKLPSPALDAAGYAKAFWQHTDIIPEDLSANELLLGEIVNAAVEIQGKGVLQAITESKF